MNPKILFTKLRPVDLTILWKIVADAKIRTILRSARELDLVADKIQAPCEILDRSYSMPPPYCEYSMVVVERSACRDPKTLREAPAAIPSAGALRRQRSEATLREPQISAFRR